MFRSIVVRFILVFMLIFVLSFGILLFSTSSVVDYYSVDFKTEVLDTAAAGASDYLELLLHSERGADLGSVLNKDEPAIDITLGSLISGAHDATLLVVDGTGRILYAIGDEEEDVKPGTYLNAKDWEEIRSIEPESALGLKSLKDVFDDTHMIRAYLLQEKDPDAAPYGAVIVCAETQKWTTLTNLINKTILVSGFWVLLAALVAVYVLTERVVSPLHGISRAAKSFAHGQFDVRLPVHGHDEIADLSEAFNQMATAITTYDQTRTTFLSSVAHDLRTPMTTIAGFVDEILEGVIPPDQQEKYLRLVSDEVQRLSRMVNTLLDLTRIEVGRRKFVMKSFNICEMARRILISFEQKIDEKHLEVEFITGEEDLFVLADYDGIYQVLYNLCDNAIKFSNERGILRLAITERVREKTVAVTVFNEGAGIAEEDRPLIFERFFKGDKSRGLDRRGVGLGLYIAKTIIDAHGGRIWVDSEVGANCEFGFTLAATQAPENERGRA